MEKKEKSVSIRFPVDLLEQVKELARTHDRSLNGEIVSMARSHVEKAKKPKEK